MNSKRYLCQDVLDFVADYGLRKTDGKMELKALAEFMTGRRQLFVDSELLYAGQALVWMVRRLLDWLEGRRKAWYINNRVPLIRPGWFVARCTDIFVMNGVIRYVGTEELG